MNYSDMFDKKPKEKLEEVEEVIVEEPLPATDEIGVVTGREVYIRPVPSLTGEEPLGTVKKGEELLIVGKEIGWYKVVTPEGLEGYIMDGFVDIV